jgi:hypothetical protein
MIALHPGTIQNGQFVPEMAGRFKDDMLKHEGKRVICSIKQFRKSRSLNQNAYAHGVVFPMIREECGYTTNEQAKEAMKFEFLREENPPLPPTVKSSAELSTAEWEEWMTQIRNWAADFLGINIPPPNEEGITYER